MSLALLERGPSENPSQADLVAELAEAIRNEDYAAAAQARDALR